MTSAVWSAAQRWIAREIDLLGGLVALGADLLLGLADDGGGLMGHLAADLVEQLAVGVVARQLGDALELARLAGDELVELAGALLELTGLAGQLVLALVERVVATVERLLALHHAVLEGAQLALALLLLGLRGLLALDDLLLGLEEGLLLHRLRGALRLADDALGLGVRGLDLGVRLAEAAVLGAAHGDGGDGGPDHEADDADYEFHARFSFSTFRYNAVNAARLERAAPYIC